MVTLAKSGESLTLYIPEAVNAGDMDGHTEGEAHAARGLEVCGEDKRAGQAVEIHRYLGKLPWLRLIVFTYIRCNADIAISRELVLEIYHILKVLLAIAEQIVKR